MHLDRNQFTGQDIRFQCQRSIPGSFSCETLQLNLMGALEKNVEYSIIVFADRLCALNAIPVFHFLRKRMNISLRIIS